MENQTDENGNIVHTYLEMMDYQREVLFNVLNGLGEEELWQQPTPEERSIGENLDHLRVLDSSILTMFKITWALSLPLVRLHRNQPNQTDIDKR